MEMTWKNPYVLGGAGLLLVVLVVAKSAGGGGSDGAFGLQSQGIATGANVQLAGIGAGLDAHAMDTAAMVDLSRESAKVSLFGQALGYLTHQGDTDLQRFAIGEAVNVNRSNNDLAFKTTSINNDTYRFIAGLEDGTRRYQIDAEKILMPQMAEISGRTSVDLLRIQGANELAINQSNAQTANAIAMIRRSEQSDRIAGDQSSQMMGMAGSILGRVVGTGSKGGLLGMFGL